MLTVSAEVNGDKASPETATGSAQVEVAASDTPQYVAAVDPASGPADEATRVILNGSDFQDGATVSFVRVTQTFSEQCILTRAYPNFESKAA